MKKIIKNTVFLLAMAIAVAGCNGSEKDENGCNFKDPIKDLPWIRKLIEEYDSPSKPSATFCQCTYKDGLTGFFYHPAVSRPIFFVLFFDCRGNLLERFDISNVNDLHDKWNVRDIKILWVHPKNK